MTDPSSAPVPEWRASLERNALWVALGAIVLAAAVVFVGVKVAPEAFYDRFWWEDIWGPLVVDAHQCKTAATCPSIDGPAGIPVKDGYTITSELTYGLVLAVMLYGIYQGLFRRYGIVADGRFVLGLLPWIMLGPLARVLEDADVFCRYGTHCDPGPFAFVYISPVIYIQIAVYVIGAMLLGVWVARRADRPGVVTGVVAAVLAAGFAVFVAIRVTMFDAFSALPPWPVVLAACALAAGLFAWRARQGRASLNLTVFVLGIPFALGSLWLIGWWVTGHVWSEAAWSGAMYPNAGFFIFACALLAALVVWGLARALVAYGVEARWGRLAARVPASLDKRAMWTALGLLAFALLAAGTIPRLAPFFQGVPRQDVLIPLAGLAGLVLLLVYAFLTVGRGVAARPGALLVFAAGINVALVFGHVMDGVATWVALEDPFEFGLPQYSEKHPFSEFLLRYWNGFLFPAAKIAMVLVVAWVLDREAKEEDRNLVGLVKMAIFVLGFAPGLRDLLRLTMGV